VSLSASDLRRLAGDRRGATAVEFALIGVIFFILLLGIIDLGRYFYTLQSVRALAADAARAAMVSSNVAIFNGGSCTAGAVTLNATALTARYPLIRTGDPPLTMTASRACYQPPTFDGSGNVATVAVSARVTARVRYTFSFLVPFLPSVVPRMDESAILEFP
jgi:Flp pilus assembly protein TadG